MRKAKALLLTASLALAASSISLSPRLRADTEKSPMKLKPGDLAPDFKLPYVDSSGEKEVSLSEYRGKKNVVLAFYIFAFTGG
jgi:AhpC/TSA family